MLIESTELPDVKVLTPKRHGDHRGYFAEMFNKRIAAEAGLPTDFVQDNQSLSVEQGVVRGLHFQLNPFAQGKLIRVLRGAILDVAVDIRRASPTFGKHVAIELSADNFKQLYIPPGFAHGFVTLTTNTEVLYKVTAFYSPAHDSGILWNDPALAINWGISSDKAILAPKDIKHPTLANAPELF